MRGAKAVRQNCSAIRIRRFALSRIVDFEALQYGPVRNLQGLGLSLTLLMKLVYRRDIHVTKVNLLFLSGCPLLSLHINTRFDIFI